MDRTLALTTLLAFASTPAFAGGTCEIEGLGGASEYNVVTLGDYTATGSDIGGKAAIGGDMNVSGYGIGDGLSTGAGTVLSVGGDLTATNGQVYNGDAEVGGDCFTTTSWNILDGTQSCNDSGAFDASSLTDEMRDLSAYLSGLTATHGTKAFATGTVELTGTGDEIVFDLDLDDVKAGFYSYVTTIRNVAITAPEGSTVIINVTGDTTILFQSMGVSLGGGVKASTIVWNFGTATSVTANGVEPKGALLAPYAHFEFDNGQMYGTAIVASFDGNGEFHETLFGGEICTPPEGDPCPYDDADNALGPAGAYNVFTFDDFDGKYSDIEGKAAIGGTAKFLHYGIASGESGGDTVLSVYGNAEISNSQIYGGDGEVGGTCVTSSLGTPDGSLTCGLGTSVFNTGDHEDDIGDLSD